MLSGKKVGAFRGFLWPRGSWGDKNPVVSEQAMLIPDRIGQRDSILLVCVVAGDLSLLAVTLNQDGEEPQCSDLSASSMHP